MRIGVLTTDTPHHRYFVREVACNLGDAGELAFVVFETKEYPWVERARRHFWRTFPNLWAGVARNPYLQSKSIGERVLAFERAHFFPNNDDSLPADLPVTYVADINDRDTAGFFDDNPCDIFFVYGTGLVHPEVFNRPPLGSINAHGGLLPGYRGLDTNLWAALRGRPEEMAVALHEVAADYDTGAVLAMERIPPITGLSLVSLRYHTTLLVVSMVLGLFKRYRDSGRAEAKVQETAGQYFGPMPHLLKLKAGRVIKAYARGADTSSAAE